MIQSFTVKNFLSFKNEVTYSFLATKDTHLEESHLVEVAEGVRLHKLGIIYGYNASGKSNLIESFQYLRQFWFAQVEDKDEDTRIIPFLLDNESHNNPSEFKIIFYIDRTKYVYNLTINKDVVINEKLEFYPSVQPANIFDRVYENGVSVISFGKKLKISNVVKDEVSVKCLPNISVFAALNQVNVNIEYINDVSNWMKNHIMPNIEPLTRLQEFSEDLILDDEYRDKITSYLQKADFNISEIKSSITVEEIPEDMIVKAKELFNIHPKEIERMEQDHTIKLTNTDFLHSVKNDEKMENFPLPISSQSGGTQRIFGLAGAILRTIEKNAFLTIDEIEAKLHPHLVEYVLEQFFRNSDQAQLLITTHYDNLFDEDDLFRKDNFWFTEKGKDGSTKLYPLSGFKGLGRISSLQKAYKYGKFGAIPNID